MQMLVAAVVMSELVKILTLSNPLEQCSNYVSGQLSGPDGINKYPIVWLDGAWLSSK
jgi:hypothetical protein